MKQGGSRAREAEALDPYLADVRRHPLLTAEEERALARAYRERGDLAAAHALVTANLRFVVKIARSYKARDLKMTDLIQEGNLGLMRAVERFDPDKGLRLVSYAVWWIRAYMQNHVLRSYSIVRMGTTQAQRRLFFSLAKTRRALAAGRNAAGEGEDLSRIARKLSVKERDVESMSQRMGARDLSLDAPVGDEDGASTRLDLLACDAPPLDQELAAAQVNVLARSRVGEALARLSPRERFIIERRLMSDDPMTLPELGQHFGISSERARQIEARAKQKLRAELLELASEIDLGATAPERATPPRSSRARAITPAPSPLAARRPKSQQEVQTWLVSECPSCSSSSASSCSCSA
jgi:RNA polymerase sigma-32 factor